MRYGLMSNFRRSWSKVGERAILPQKQAFENRYLFTALSPVSGESFHLMGIDDMDLNATQAFLTAFKAEYPNQHIVLVWDNAPCHRPKIFREISGLTVLFLPPYSPQLNPTERFFEEIRRVTCNTIFETLDVLEKKIAAAVNTWSDNVGAMKKLLGYEWILNQYEGVN